MTHKHLMQFRSQEMLWQKKKKMQQKEGVVREGITEEVTFEQRLEGGKGGGHEANRRESIPGRGHGTCKGPEVVRTCCADGLARN